jgi:hypothetical protein
MFYRLVIQNNPDGTLSGAAAYDTPTSDARPITADDLAGFMPDVDVAALGQKEAMESAHAAALAALADQHAADLAAANEKAASDQAAAVEAAKLAIQVNLDGIVAEAEPHFAAVMAAYPDDAHVTGLGAALGKAKGHTTEARRAKLEAARAAALAAATEAEAQIAAL